MKHPADRIRAYTLWLVVCCTLLGRDMLKIRRWAGEAREIERETRRRHEATLNDLTEAHLERVSQLQARIRDLTAPAPTTPDQPSP